MKKGIQDSVTNIIDQFDDKFSTFEKRLESVVAPTRRSVLQRFPIVFSLLTTFGVVTTFLGFELILANMTFIYSRPWLVLGIGVLVLVLTGSLYKKLA